MTKAKSPSEWKKIIEESYLRKSSMEKYCQSKDISPSAFYNWKRKLTPKSSSFVELKDDAILPSEKNSGLELIFKDLTVRLPKNFDEHCLKKCLSCLKELS